MPSVVALVSTRGHFVLVMTFLVVTYWDCASVDIGEKLSREQDTTDILWSVSVQYWTHLCCTLSLYTCIPSTQANQRRTFNLHSPPINQSIDLMIIYYRHKYYCYCHHIIISRLESFSLLTDRKSSNKDWKSRTLKIGRVEGYVRLSAFVTYWKQESGDHINPLWPGGELPWEVSAGSHLSFQCWK